MTWRKHMRFRTPQPNRNKHQPLRICVANICIVVDAGQPFTAKKVPAVLSTCQVLLVSPHLSFSFGAKVGGAGLWLYRCARCGRSERKVSTCICLQRIHSLQGNTAYMQITCGSLHTCCEWLAQSCPQTYKCSKFRFAYLHNAFDVPQYLIV